MNVKIPGWTDGKTAVIQNGKSKIVRSESYNYDFNSVTGFFARWGKTRDDDPQIAPESEILDIEVSTICKGPGGKLCKFCYKANTPNGKNMSFETFKIIVDKMKYSQEDKRIGITQLAIGADAQCESNPDIWKMMEYSRKCHIIPNITIADISDETADKLSSLAGAVAVSRYDDKNLCYDSVKKLTDLGMDQVNIHAMISQESLEQVKETILDYHTDPRLTKMKAIVLLSLKQQGRGVGFKPLTQSQFKELVDLAIENNVQVGFDSCGAHSFINAIKDHPNYDMLVQQAEPCESTLFSSYINVEGKFFPCSFVEDTPGWEDGIDVVAAESFESVWNDERTIQFRNKLHSCGRNCPVFTVNGVKV